VVISKIKYFGLTAILLFSVSAWSAQTEYDTLELEASKSNRTLSALHYSVNEFNGRFYIAAERGMILYSDDQGETWTQADVPVRVDMLDITFPTKNKGWASGHRGVILHSEDGGATWEKQYDGNLFGHQGLDFYTKRLAEDPGSEINEILIGEMEFAISQGSDKPFFKIYFANDKLGYAFGAYGIFVRTVDGGQTWQPIMHNISNDYFYHIFDYAVSDDGTILISGESGVVLKSAVLSGQTEVLETPYEGSFFTCLIANDGSFIVAGLRGNAFRSIDSGQTWQEINKPKTGSIIDSIGLSDGRVALLAQSGHVLLSNDNGQSFTMDEANYTANASSIVEVRPGELIVVGKKGVKSLTLNN